MSGLIRFCIDNFSHVFPILLSAGFGLIIMFERFVALTKSYPLDHFEGFFERMRTLVMRDQLSEAIALCERYRGKPAARIVREGLMRAHQPEHLIESGLQIIASEDADKITSRTAFLGTIANVA